MSCRLPARANVLASLVVTLAVASACSDALPTTFDGPGGLTADDTSFRRDGLPGNSRKSTVSSVEISPDGFSVRVGDQATLTATIRNRNGQTLDRVPVWRSSDPAVATVTDGAVRAIKAGTTLMTASVDGISDTATATITTTPIVVDSVIVDPATARLIVTQSLTLTARPVDPTGTVVANRAVGWATSDASIATVSPAGVVTAVATGSTVVRATVDGNTTAVGVTVSPVPSVAVAAVTVSPSPATLREGATLQFNAVTADAGGAVLTGRTITWASSNDHVATVSASGLLTAVAAGTVTVTAISEGQSGTSSVQVTPSVIPVATVTMSVPTASLTAGQSLQLVATAKDAGGNALAGRTTAWSASNGAAATVSGSGLVSALAPGQATVTATVEGRSATTAVTVTAPVTPPPPPPPTTRAGYYVAPNGSASGAGTMASPWTLASVLAGTKDLSASDTVWVRGGTYSGQFYSYLAGTPSRPIVVRQYPGERATIDGNLVVVGANVTWWGLEIMNSTPLAYYRMGVNNRAPGNQFVNLVVHDHASNGIGLWIEGPGSSVYGSLIYNNGTNTNQDHGIYANNDAPSKSIEDNILFDNQAYGLHAYASTGQYINNFLIRGNVSFNNGLISSLAGRPDLFVGGATPATGIVLDHNYTYRSDDGETVALGYGGTQNGSLTVVDNYFVGAMNIQGWSSITQTGNTVARLTARPSDIRVYVRPNRYEKGRANVIVYNWANAGSVTADMSGVLQPGDRYEVRNAQDFYAPPVTSGTYAGGSLSIPIVAINPVRPIGRPTVPAPSTGTQFGVYVVLKTN